MTTVDELVERINALEDQVRSMQQDRDRVLKVIHDLNDLLAALKGHGQLAQMEPSRDRTLELSDVVLNSVRRAQDLIRVLLRDFRRDTPTDENAAPRDPAEFRVLIADDETQVRTLLVELMTKNGFDVTAASNGEDAIGVCHVKGFDLIFMDFRLGDMTGVTALREIRKFLPDVRVIFVTGDPASEEIRSVVLKEGADGFITKPFDVPEIDQAVQHLFHMGAA
jgi:CheY-like chemotaxis protein